MNVGKLSLDTTLLKPQIQDVLETLKAWGVGLDDVKTKTVEHNSVTGKTALELKGVSKAGEKFTLTIKDIADETETAKIKSKEYTTQLTAQEKIEKALTKAIKDRAKAEKAATKYEQEVAKREKQWNKQKKQEKKELAAADKQLAKEGAAIKAGQRKTAAAFLKEIEDGEKKKADLQNQRTRQDAQTTAQMRKEGEEQSKITNKKIADQFRLKKGYKDTGLAGKKAGQEVLISWKSVIRLFAVQALHASIAKLKLVFREAMRDALEFTKRVAEIRTISGDASETTKDWSSALIALGRDLPFTQLEVAEAAYQALSNQVIETTKDLEFVREAGKLAIIGVSDIKTAVNTLTSVINAYGSEAGRTSEISAILFKSIELGRTRLSELEQNLGRVTILSAKLGITFEEQQAAMSTLTIQGLKQNVANTLLVNISNKLIRPSKRMSELFKEWGVVSGEAAVKTFGYANVLNKVFDAVQKSGKGLEELGEIAQRVRATIGFMGLDTAKFAENLREMSNATDGYGDKVEEIQQSLGVRLQQELSRVNALLTRIGVTLLKATDSFFSFSGGAENSLKLVTRAMTDLAFVLTVTFAGPRLLAAYHGIAKITTGLYAMATGAKVAEGALAGLPGVLLVAGAFAVSEAIQYWVMWEERVLDNIETVRKTFQKFHEEIIKHSDKTINEWVKKFDKGLKDVFGSLRLVNVEMTKLQDLLATDLEEVFDGLSKSLEDFGKTSSEALKDNLKAMRDEISVITKDISNAQNRLAQLTAKRRTAEQVINDRAFNQAQRGLTPQQQARNLETRADVADSDHSIADLEKILKLNEQFTAELGKQAGQIVTAKVKQFENIGGTVTEQQRLALTNQIFEKLKQTYGVELEYQRINNKITEQLERRKVAAKKFEELEAQRELDKQNEKADADDLLKKQEEKVKLYEKELQLLQGIDVLAAKEKIEKSITEEDPTKRVEAVNTALQEIIEDQHIQTVAAAEAAGVKVIEIEKIIAAQKLAIARDLENQILLIKQQASVQVFQDAEERFKADKKKLIEQAEEIRKVNLGADKTVALELERIRTRLVEDRPLFPEHAPTLSPTGQRTGSGQRIRLFDEQQRRRDAIKATEKLIALNKDITTERDKAVIDEEKLAALMSERAEAARNYANLLTQANSPLREDRNLGGETTTGQAVDKITDALDDAANIQSDFEELSESSGELKTSIDILWEEIKEQGLDRKFELDQRKNNTRSIQELTAEVILNMKATRQLKRTLEGVKILRDAAPKATGGLIRGPGGVDNVPAWLTAGEYVINAQATRENLPLLQAINNQPQRFNQGGEVRNFTFGNINVTGGATGKQTARQIARELKREINRGTVSL